MLPFKRNISSSKPGQVNEYPVGIFAFLNSAQGPPLSHDKFLRSYSPFTTHRNGGHCAVRITQREVPSKTPHPTLGLTQPHIQYLLGIQQPETEVRLSSPHTRCADKSLAQPGRKQTTVSAKMAWISVDALPCRKKIIMTARVSMLLKLRASLTCFRAYFLPGRAKDFSARRKC